MHFTFKFLWFFFLQYYLEHKPAADPNNKLRSSVLFSDFQNLQRIWTHPRVMRYNSDKFEINAQKKVKIKSFNILTFLDKF